MSARASAYFAAVRAAPGKTYDWFGRFRAAARKPNEARSWEEKLLISSSLRAFEFIVNIVFRIGSTLIVTRLLSPEDFGVFGVVLTFQIIMTMLTDFGIRPLIIVSKDAKDPAFLRTCWSVQAVRGVALWGVALLIAGGLALLQEASLVGEGTVYADPVLPLALAVASLQLVGQGLESVNQHIYARDLRWFPISVQQIFGFVALPVTTILIALVRPDVWALVFASVIVTAAKTVLSFVLFEGPSMRPHWQSSYARHLFKRGKWIMGSSGFLVATQTADRLMFGAFVPPQVLGTYVLALQFIDLPRQFQAWITSSVLVQHFRDAIDTGKQQGIAERYYRFRVPFDVIICIVAGGMMTAAPTLIEILYDPRYAPSGQMMQILAIGLPLSLLTVINQAFIASERFSTLAFLGLVEAVTVWSGLILALAVFDSFTAALFVIALYPLPQVILLLVLARRQGWVLIWREFLFYPLIGVGAALGLGFNAVCAAIAG